MTRLDGVLDGVDSIVLIGFDSLRTEQAVSAAEVAAIKHFLDDPDPLIFICPHHDIGEAAGSAGEERFERQFVEYLHHGDHGVPPRQGFGGLARTLLAGLGVAVENRFGLRPAAVDGVPAPVEIDRALDELGLLRDVEAFHLHPHLPQLERIGPSIERTDVLARQKIDLTARPHPFTHGGRTSFDALLQSRPDTFAGKLLVCDTTMFSSTAGGVENRHRFWANIVRRAPRR
jgi:hypothetical protein